MSLSGAPVVTMSIPQARDFAMQPHDSGGSTGGAHTTGRQQRQRPSQEYDNVPLHQASQNSHTSNNFALPTSMSQRNLHAVAHSASCLPGPPEAESVRQGSCHSQTVSVSRHITLANDEAFPIPSDRQNSRTRSHTQAQPGGSNARPHGHQCQPSQASSLMSPNQSNASRSEFHALPAMAHRPPLQSRIFGLGADLRPQTELVDPAFFPGGVVPAEAATLSGSTDSAKQQPTFSVELKAQSFDHRGYPVYSGRAATIRGAIRVRKAEGCDVAIKISAHTTSGSAAAVWDGVALQPPESGSERTVFQTMEKVTPADGQTEYSHPTSSSEDDAVLVMPFHCNLPMGGSTRVVDGNVETVAVALPPSFEMSSEQDAREKAVLRSTGGAGGGGGAGGTVLTSGAASIKTSKTKMTAMTLKDAVETGLQQVYRVGCFYRITFTLLRKKGSERERKSSASFFSKKSKVTVVSPSPSSTTLPNLPASSKKTKNSDTLSIPFVFLGEPTNLPPPPSNLPPVRPQNLLQPSVPLARGWSSEVATAKWSGMLFKTLKRNVQLEVFLPADRIIQAPSIIPVLVIIRPEDPEMLPQQGAVIYGAGQSQSNGGSPRAGLLAEADEGRVPTSFSSAEALGPVGLSAAAAAAPSGPLASPSSTAEGEATQRHPESQADDSPGDNETLRGDDGSLTASSAGGGNALTRLIRTSLSISRPSNRDPSSPTGVPTTVGSSPSGPQGQRPLKKKSSRSTFTFSLRPNTAPSQGSSEGSPANTDASYTVRGGGAGSSSCASGNRLDLPGLVRVSLLQNIYYSSSSVNEPPKNKRRLVSLADMEEVDLAKLAEEQGAAGAVLNGSEAVEQLEEAKKRGIRVLRGLFKVGREATPSFRVQGIELKYAIKVDLMPFNPRGSKSSKYHASSPPRTPPNKPSMQSTCGAQSTYTPSVAGKSASAGSEGRVSSGGGGAVPHMSTSTPLHSTLPSVSSSQWSPGQHQGPRQGQQHPNQTHWQPQQHDGAIASGLPGSQSMREVASLFRGQPSSTGTNEVSEAGWTRRSPSDQTVLGPDTSKLQKTVGALWVNVRLVKGRGAL